MKACCGKYGLKGGRLVIHGELGETDVCGL